MFQIKWVWKNLKGYRLMYVSAMLISFFITMLTPFNSIMSQKIVDEIIIGTKNSAGVVVHHTENLILYVCLMVLVTLTRTLILYLGLYFYEKATQALIYNIRNYVYKNLQIQELSFFDTYRTGDLMTRFTGDLDMVRHSFAYLVKTFIELVVIFLSTLAYFLYVNVWLTLIMLAVLPLVFVISQKFSKNVKTYHYNIREKLTTMNSIAQENIAANKVVTAFAREDYENEKFDKSNKDFLKANIKAALYWLKYFPYIEILAQSLAFTTLLVGGLFVIYGQITMGELAAFTGLCWSLTYPMRNMGGLLNDMQRFFVSASKVIEIYYSQPRIINKIDAEIPSDKINPVIEFKDVSLKIKNTTILDKINLKFDAGETIVIMGPTGSGKTTLVNLICRLYDTTAGEILVDDINVTKWNLQALRKNIAYATQDVFLFSDTVDGNIAYGDLSLTLEQTKYYAKLAQADFIDNMENGYDTIIGERGVGLSGGQKQRLALARALAIRPSILILDDTTSAVDFETEKIIESNLKNLDFKCTKVIVSSRASIAEHADKIIVLDNGKVAQQGTHSELINQEGFYKEIYEMQKTMGVE